MRHDKRRGWFWVWLLAACAAVAGWPAAALAHEELYDEFKEDREDPYQGPGHRGYPLPPDENGLVRDMPAQNVTLLSWITLPEFQGNPQNGNDCWGYVSPAGREYAIMGLSNGTAFVDITDPVNPVLVAQVPGANSLWRDMKTYQGFAYSVNEADGGIQVIDLRQIDNGVVTLVGSVTESGLRTSHNIAVNPASGFLYLAGANIGNGGLVAVDARDPANPRIAGMWTGHYVHDVMVVTYEEGPYAGREIAFAFAAESGMRIIDVTDKSNMFLIATHRYPNLSYCHYGWVSEDRRYVFINDEFDELYGRVSSTTTYVVNIEDLANPFDVTSFTNGLPAIDHNPTGRSHFVFEANYRSGLRIYDFADLNDVREIGFFDTYPASDSPDFNGAWGVFAGFPSGVVIVSDMERGLFVFDVSDATGEGGIPGDFDGDGDVDVADFAFFSSCFGGSGVPCGGACCEADLDGDGDVDIADFSIFAGGFTGSQ